MVRIAEPSARPRSVPAYAEVSGVLAVALAIAGCLVPVFGVLFVTPLAIILNSVALFGGYRRVAIVTVVLVLVNLLISPSFWLNVAAGASQPEAWSNRFLSYFDMFGLAAMFCLVAWGRRN
jgi:hypothetical protein